MNLNKHQGQLLRSYLSERGIASKFVAEKLNISTAAFSKYLKSEQFRPDTLQSLLSVLNVSEEELLGAGGVEESAGKYETGKSLDGMVVMSQDDYRKMLERELELERRLSKYIERENEELRLERNRANSPVYQTSSPNP